MKITESAIQIVKKLVDEGHIAYFAGGFVRDLIMRHPSDDIDIATSASSREVQALFPNTIPVGVQFGIVIVIEGGVQFEVATFRKESGHLDGRRPTKIERATPEEDALRRDFTINGLFYNPLTQEVLDYVGGRKDIAGKVIRAIGDPHKRFLEDRLRMIRAVRYAIRFQFDIEAKTRRALVQHAKDLFPSVAIERVWKELEKMSRFSRFDHALMALHKLKLLPVIFPALDGMSEKQLQQHLQYLPIFPKGVPLIAELLELFPDFDLAQKLLLCDYFKLSNKERAFVEFYHLLKEQLMQPLTFHAWAYLYANPHFMLAFSLHLAHLPQHLQEEVIHLHEERQKRLLPHIKRVQTQDPLVKAHHLLAKGYKAGKELGQLLKRAEEIAINEECKTAEEVLERLCDE